MNEMHSVKLIFVLNLVILLSQIDGKKACIEDERIGLLELKSFLKFEVVNGSEHVLLLPSWVDDPTSNCCYWERVTCNSTTGRVDRLSLFNIRDSNLNSFDCDDLAPGPKPHWNISLFQPFKDLKTLILAYTCIRWKQNQGLLRLQKLETLDLSHNTLTKSDLQSLTELKSLKKLNLSRNAFNESFPARELSVFENLEILDLSSNYLQDSPRKLDSAKFSKLTNVKLSSNWFNTTDIMRFMGSIPSLKSLDLSGNQDIEDIALSNEDFMTFGRLEVLDLSGIHFLGGIPQNIGKLSSLKELYLADNYFNGTLPVPGLCELRRLQVLDIHYNYFEGTLPPCLSNLTSLKILDLHDNLFSGPIAPHIISSQKFLQFVDISSNNFEGPFSFSSMFNHSKLEVFALGGGKVNIENDKQAEFPLFQLKALRLSNCNMKNAPRFLLNQHRLEWVDISHNKLSGALPSWLLENNTDLRFLNLKNNSFTGKLDPFPQNPISGMVHLDVSNNHIDGHLPKDLGRVLPNLQSLSLSYNFFEGEIPPSVGAMTRLSLLDLSFNNLSGEVPKELLKDGSALEALMLNNNRFHGEFFSNRFNLSSLFVLELGNNDFTGSLLTKEEFPMFVFDVSNNHLTGKIPNGIGANVILLQNNSFEGEIPCELFSPSAQVIDISQNLLSGPIPPCLPYSIEVLDLRDNKLSGTIPGQFRFLGSIRILVLGNNRFSGWIPTELCQLSQISILDLSNNSFSGTIPGCLSNIAFDKNTVSIRGYISDKEFSSRISLSPEMIPLQELYESSSWRSPSELVLTYKMDFVTKNRLLSYQGDGLTYMTGLDLSCNNLSGSIPQSLGKLSSIHALNLSHNHLTGHIPVSFSNLSQVESLDFSYNSLSGKIPSELVNLNFLAVFSVAHNNLSGRVPDRGQFATFGTSSYEGNPFLSGLPSEKNRTTKVVETPLPSDDETGEKWYEIDRPFFFSSFIATYCVILLSFGAVLYINPYWRGRWLYFIENFIYSCYYLVVDTLRKLATIFNN